MKRIESNENSLKPGVDFSWCDVKGELVVVNVHSGEYHIFNDIGRLIWLSVSEGIEIEEIAGLVASQYDVKWEKSLSDVRGFINSLIQGGLLENQVAKY